VLPRQLYESDDTTWLEHPDKDVEGTHIERKEKAKPHELGRQISGFANGLPPGGLVVLGVSKTGQLVGLGDRRSKMEELLGELRDVVDWHGWEHRWVVGHTEGALLLYIYVPVPPDRVVCLSDGTAYRRVGSRTVQMSADEISELKDSRGERRAELRVVTKFDPSELETTLTKAFMEGVVTRNGLRLPLTQEAALENKGLVRTTTEGRSFTVAGVVALTKAPVAWVPGARLRFLRFQGTQERFGSERNAIKDRWFDGPIPTIVEDFRAFMRDQVRELEYLGPDGRVVREVEYPEEAWEEAVVNALVHRSYALSSSAVFVRMFDDRIEVESPGGFPPGVRFIEEAIAAQSAPRNPILAQALQYLKLVWLANEGTRRMHQRMTEMGLPPPRLTDVGGAKVVVTLQNDWQRRGSARTAQFGDAWADVSSLLSQDLAIMRRRGVQQWDSLSGRGSLPPASTVAAAESQLRNPDVGDDEKTDIVRLFARLPDHVLRDPLRRLTQELVEGTFSSHPSVMAQIGAMAARDEQCVSLVLSHLESISPPADSDTSVAATYEALMHTLRNRTHREPPPTRDWFRRVIDVCKRGGSPTASELFKEITGRPLDRNQP
jgi:ATP-dependent DNA helicase RecG